MSNHENESTAKMFDLTKLGDALRATEFSHKRAGKQAYLLRAAIDSPSPIHNEGAVGRLKAIRSMCYALADLAREVLEVVDAAGGNDLTIGKGKGEGLIASVGQADALYASLRVSTDLAQAAIAMKGDSGDTSDAEALAAFKVPSEELN